MQTNVDDDTDVTMSAPMPRFGGEGPDPLIGRTINERFRVVGVLARGGMGKVYRAEQSPLGRQVALKVLEPNYQGDHDPEFHKRFFLEASTQSKLTHPNTVTIFDYGRTDDDVYFIAMELLEGRTLHRCLRDEGPLSAERATSIARQVARSLREAHSLGVVHRDLKPANVFLVRRGDEQDFVKVLDFGLVKDLEDKGEDLTQTGLFMGSPKYMSPEQIRGDTVDARTDVYALGVLLYEMLTGHPPFERDNSVNVLMAHVHEPVPLMDTFRVVVPPELEKVTRRALSKSPDDRFAGMDEFLAALKDAAIDQGLSMSRSSDIMLSDEFGILTDSVPSSFAPPLERTDHPSGRSGVGAPTRDLRAPGVEISRRLKWMLVSTLMLSAVGIAAFAAFRLSNRRSGGPQPVAIVLNTDGTDRAAAGAGELRTQVELISQPPGARVFIDDSDQSYETPARLVWTGNDARRGRTIRFRFVLDGYREMQAVRTILGPELTVRGRLQMAGDEESRPRRSSTTSRTGAIRGMMGSGTGALGPSGYKLEPY